MNKRSFAVVTALLLSLLFLSSACGGPAEKDPGSTVADVAVGSADETGSLDFYGITIDGAEAYTGTYYEDGADVAVTNVLALRVTNNSDRYLQYMEIHGVYGDKNVSFSFSVLPPGVTCLAAEAKQTPYDEKLQLKNPATDTFLFFDEAPDARTDLFSYRAAEGTVSVTNITDDTLTGTLRLCYKNTDENGTLIGGIAYSATAADVTMRAGITVDVGCGHFDPQTSRIMFTEFIEDAAQTQENG